MAQQGNKCEIIHSTYIETHMLVVSPCMPDVLCVNVLSV